MNVVTDSNINSEASQAFKINLNLDQKDQEKIINADKKLIKNPTFENINTKTENKFSKIDF